MGSAYDEASLLLFRFLLRSSLFQPGASYDLLVDASCGAAGSQQGLAAPSPQVVRVIADCSAGAAPTARPASAAAHSWSGAQQWLEGAMGAVAGQPLAPRQQQQQQQQLSSSGSSMDGGGPAWRDAKARWPPQQQQQLPHPARVLAESAAVSLQLASTGSGVTVDGYSGLARQITASAVPFCSASGGSTAAANATFCLSEVTLRSRGPALNLSMLVSGATVTGALPPSVITITGGDANVAAVSASAAAPAAGCSSSSSGSSSACQQFNVSVALPTPNVPSTLSVGQGALAPYGADNAASNQVTVLWDTAPPVVRRVAGWGWL